jgi:hypothetical protein
MRHKHAELPSQHYYTHYYCVGLLFVTSGATPSYQMNNMQPDSTSTASVPTLYHHIISNVIHEDLRTVTG